jgi:PST family polysaccharide transporter
MMTDEPPRPSNQAGGAARDEGTEDLGGTLTSEEVRQRASRGAALLVARGVAVQLIGFATNLALTRLFTPSDFGVTTLGLTIVSAANTIADAGIASSLIARKESPTRAELSSINGIQLLATGAFSAASISVGFALGGVWLPTAIIFLALPFYSLRTRSLLLFERSMQYTPRILVQVADLVVYAVVAIALGEFGVGVWSMPLALVARTAGGTVLAVSLSPVKHVGFSLRLGPVRPLLAFGVRFQVRTVLLLARDLVLVAVIGGIGGFTYLGYFGFASRLLSIPQLAATSLAEVMFPAFSRLVGSGVPVADLLKRATESVAIINVLLTSPLAASSAGIIPTLFTHKWESAAPMLPGAALSLIAVGPVGGIVVSYFYARGDATTPLRIALINVSGTVAFTALLARLTGVFGIGAGAAVGSLLAMPHLVRWVRRSNGPDLRAAFAGPAAGAVAAMGFGWWLCHLMHDTLTAGIASFAGTFALQAALLLLTNRHGLTSSYASTARAVRLAVSRRP